VLGATGAYKGACRGKLVAFLPILVILFALLWFVMIRPQRQQRAQQARMLQTLEVGDEVVTAGGMYGEIRTLDDEDLTVEIAPEVVVRIARRAVVGNITLDNAEDEEEREATEEDELPDAKSPEPNPS
jgi:preprotein translocase subunit YajC